MKLKWFYLAAAVAIAGCGGGGKGGGGGSQPQTQTGVLTDSAVYGANYQASPSGLSGVTNGQGEFRFRAGDDVTFTVAGYRLPPVPAAERINPLDLAKGFTTDAAAAQTAALNLAILFQSLDSDGDPSNGISVDEAVDISSFLDTTVLQQPSADFASNLQTALPEATVPAPLDALQHFYLNEMSGNWRLAQIVGNAEEVIDKPTPGFDIFIAFDASGRSLWVEYNTAITPATCSPFSAGYSAIYTGKATFDSTNVGMVTMASNGRALNTGCAAGSTDHVADMFDGSISFEGAQLVITHPTEGHRAYFNRFKNVKDSLVGVWSEMGGLVTRNTNGTLEFGDTLDGLFQIYTGNRAIFVTLDRLADGENCEQNGVHVSGYSYDASAGTVTYGASLLNHIWEMPNTCGKTTPDGWGAVTAGASTDNGSQRPWDSGTMARNLSASERDGDFRQVALEETLYTVSAKTVTGGSLSPVSLDVLHGNTGAFTVTADAGYEVDTIIGCGGTLSGDGATYTTGAITANCLVTPAFKLKQYSVTTVVTAGDGRFSPASVTVEHGSTTALTLTPGAGHLLDTGSVSGCGGALAGDVWTTGPVTADCIVSATFVPEEFTVSVSVSGPGSATPASVQVPYGQTTDIVLTPDPDNMLISADGCGGTLSGNTFTTGPVSAACTVSAVFAASGYQVTTTAVNGSFDPANPMVAAGATQAFTLTPDEGYELTGASGCGGTLSGSTFTTAAINAACEVTATFALKNYTVTATISGGNNGMVSPTSQPVTHGETASITVTPNGGFAIDSVTGCGGITTTNGTTYTTATPVTAACDITVIFAATGAVWDQFNWDQANWQ